MHSAVENFRHRALGEVLTGPVARGGTSTVRRHVDSLSDDALALDAYVALIAVVGAAAGASASPGAARMIANAVASAVEQVAEHEITAGQTT